MSNLKKLSKNSKVERYCFTFKAVNVNVYNIICIDI